MRSLGREVVRDWGIAVPTPAWMAESAGRGLTGEANLSPLKNQTEDAEPSRPENHLHERTVP